MVILQLAHLFQEFDVNTIGLYKIMSYNSIHLKTKKNLTISLFLII